MKLGLIYVTLSLAFLTASCWTLNDFYQQFINAQKQQKKSVRSQYYKKTDLRRANLDRTASIKTDKPNIEVERFDLEPKTDRSSSFWEKYNGFKPIPNIHEYYSQPTEPISRFLDKPQLSNPSLASQWNPYLTHLKSGIQQPRGSLIWTSEPISPISQPFQEARSRKKTETFGKPKKKHNIKNLHAKAITNTNPKKSSNIIREDSPPSEQDIEFRSVPVQLLHEMKKSAATVNDSLAFLPSTSDVISSFELKPTAPMMLKTDKSIESSLQPVPVMLSYAKNNSNELGNNNNLNSMKAAQNKSKNLHKTNATKSSENSSKTKEKNTNLKKVDSKTKVDDTNISTSNLNHNTTFNNTNNDDSVQDISSKANATDGNNNTISAPGSNNKPSNAHFTDESSSNNKPSNVYFTDESSSKNKPSNTHITDETGNNDKPSNKYFTDENKDNEVNIVNNASKIQNVNELQYANVSNALKINLSNKPELINEVRYDNQSGNQLNYADPNINKTQQNILNKNKPVLSEDNDLSTLNFKNKDQEMEQQSEQKVEKQSDSTYGQFTSEMSKGTANPSNISSIQEDAPISNFPDLKNLLSDNFLNDNFTFSDSSVSVSTGTCTVMIKPMALGSLDGLGSGKISFTALMSKLLPNVDLASSTNDLIVHGKFDATGIVIDKCKSQISFDLKCRELLDIIPNKLRLSNADLNVQFNYDQMPKTILGFNLTIRGYINLEFRSRKLEVTAIKQRGSSLFAVDMSTIDLEIPEFTKLFTDAEIIQQDLPPDLATLISSSIHKPRITGLYDMGGAFEFVASAKSPASIFPSQPMIYVIVQKPKLGKVVSGLIASFESAMYRSFLSSILNQDLSNIPLFSDVRTDMAIGISSEGLFVVKDESFNREVGSLFTVGKAIKKGLTVKAKLPVQKMVDSLQDNKDNSNNLTNSFPETVLTNVEVRGSAMHIDFPEDLRIGLSNVPVFFAQRGQDMNFPKEKFNMEDTELQIKSYEIDNIDKKSLTVQFFAPAPMKIGTLMILQNVEATLKRNEASIWSFIATGGYQLGNTTVSITMTSKTEGFVISSVPSSIRSSILVSLIDKQKDLLTPELQLYHMEDFVIENFKVAGSLTDRTIIRFSGEPSVFGIDDAHIEFVATEDMAMKNELAMGVLFRKVDLDNVLGRMLDRKMLRRSWATGVNIGLIISSSLTRMSFQFESEGLTKAKIDPGVHLRVLLVRPEIGVCKGDSLCKVLSAEMPRGSAFHLSGGMANGAIKLTATIKDPLVLSRSLQLVNVSLKIDVMDSIKVYVMASLSLKGVAIRFIGDMQVANTGQLQLNMMSQSIWDEPFGLKGMRFYNATLTAAFEPGLPIPMFDMKAKLIFGLNMQDTSKQLEAHVLVKLSSQDPSKTSFTAKIRDLTFERLASACRTKKPLLRFQQESIFLEEATLGFEQAVKEEIGNEPINNGAEFNYKGELKLNGRISVLGQSAEYTIKFLKQNTQLLTEVWLPDLGVNQGLLIIRAGLKQQQKADAPTPTGPTLLVRMDASINSAVVVGKISTLGFSSVSAIKVDDAGFTAKIFAGLPGNVNANVSLHAAYQENIQNAEFLASSCLPIQTEVKDSLFRLLRETASQTKKTLMQAEERVTTTEKIYETTKVMIDQFKTKSKEITDKVKDIGNKLMKLRKGIKSHCVVECGESCMGLPSWKNKGISMVGKNKIGSPSWDTCRKKIPDLNCITRCLGRKVIENVKASNKQLDLQKLMLDLSDTKRSFQDARVLVNRAGKLVDSTVDGLEKVNKEIKVGIDISKFLNNGKPEGEIEISKVCFEDSLDNAERSLVLFKITLEFHGKEANINIKAALDGSLVINIAEGIADNLYPGYFEFTKKIEQVKLLLSNLDGEKNEIQKQVGKTESNTDPDQRSQVTWNMEEEEYRKLAFAELPRFTLSDDETIHAFEEKSLWRVAPTNNPLYDTSTGQESIVAHKEVSAFHGDHSGSSSCSQLRGSVDKYSDIINPLSEFTENFLQEKIMFYRQKNRRLADLRMIDDQIKSDCFLENCTMEDMDNALSYLARARDGTLKWAGLIDGQIEQQNKAALNYFSERAADIISTDKGISLKDYLSKVKDLANKAIKKSDISVKQEVDSKLQKFAKELNSILLGSKSMESLTKVAPRIFNLKRQVQTLKRNKVACREKVVPNDVDDKTLAKLEESQRAISELNEDIIDENKNASQKLKKIDEDKKITDHSQLHPTNNPALTENPVLKNNIYHAVPKKSNNVRKRDKIKTQNRQFSDLEDNENRLYLRDLRNIVRSKKQHY